MEHAGEYTCAPSNSGNDTIRLYVSAGKTQLETLVLLVSLYIIRAENFRMVDIEINA